MASNIRRGILPRPSSHNQKVPSQELISPCQDLSHQFCDRHTLATLFLCRDWKGEVEMLDYQLDFRFSSMSAPYLLLSVCCHLKLDHRKLYAHWLSGRSCHRRFVRSWSTNEIFAFTLVWRGRRMLQAGFFVFASCRSTRTYRFCMFSLLVGLSLQMYVWHNTYILEFRTNRKEFCHTHNWCKPHE